MDPRSRVNIPSVQPSDEKSVGDECTFSLWSRRLHHQKQKSKVKMEFGRLFKRSSSFFKICSKLDQFRSVARNHKTAVACIFLVSLYWIAMFWVSWLHYAETMKSKDFGRLITFYVNMLWMFIKLVCCISALELTCHSFLDWGCVRGVYSFSSEIWSHFFGCYDWKKVVLLNVWNR